ncbi:hypothetical protein [Spirulina subsalsa]|uniref:hypothetical protein n=1 Tax=Spirulina subsalsa TaxID=54311 RepID=UPI00232E8216|nr:hypothetical protein [Spirulina subsalsa]
MNNNESFVLSNSIKAEKTQPEKTRRLIPLATTILIGDIYSDPKSIGDLISSSTRGLSPLPVHESKRIAIALMCGQPSQYLMLFSLPHTAASAMDSSASNDQYI